MISPRLSCRVATLLACGLLVPQGAVHAASPPAATLIAPDGTHDDELGNAVAASADGSTVIVAAWGATVSGKANQGALYVFERPAGGWSNTSQAAKLTASDGASQDTLGYSVAVSSDGSTVVAGAPYATSVANASGPGAVYVFVRPAGGWKNAAETAKLTASDQGPGPYFGLSVGVSGDGSTVAVGSQFTVVDGSKEGAVYVFVKPAGDWRSVAPAAKLQGSDEGSHDLFGHAVALSRDGSTIAVGADGAAVAGGASFGAVYVFLRPGSGWASGTETAKLTLGAAAGAVDFAYAVGVSGDGATVIASANNFFVDRPGPGAVYVFPRPGNGWSNATPSVELTASDGVPGASLGDSIAISADGSTIFAGAAGGNGLTGAAYEFVEPAGGWGSATETIKIPAVDIGLFGWSVAVSDDGSTLVAGAIGAIVSGNFDQGAAYVFANPRCRASDTTLCLDDQPGDQRWRIDAKFATGTISGAGHAVELASLGVSHGGLFWFFDGTNPEVLLKVLDGCAVNQHFWVFSSATTNVGFTVTVTDTRGGRAQVYTNQNGTAATPIQDTSAFACMAGGAGPAKAADAFPASASAEPLRLPAASAVSAAPAAVPVPASGPAGCSTTATSLCIAGRFAIAVQFETAQGGGHAGSGETIDLQGLGVARGGLFWFFAADNPELLVKVLDGCALNARFWIFYAAGTNVGFTLTVTDIQTGQMQTYRNSDGTPAPPVQDTSALPCT
ncbi:MAG TPA: FG-GAP repeat protein [Thermoanaerobaculia bacterium]|nr:FG-GAP repeat protein [Thermoanaerobaculia bacterium]